MDGGIVRIAVAVDALRGLESPCSASLEAACGWVVAELRDGQVMGIETMPRPSGGGPSGELGALLPGDLGVDVLVATHAAERTRQALLAQGVAVALGAQGVARRALIEYVTGTLGLDAGHGHSPEDECRRRDHGA